MINVWRFKIELESDKVFDEISAKYNTKFPDDLKNFIIENNAASPVKNCVDINGKERVYSETLSFNSVENDATTYASVKTAFEYDFVIPFALDPFGNLFCYSLENSHIVFYEHEENVLYETSICLDEFLRSLH